MTFGQTVGQPDVWSDVLPTLITLLSPLNAPPLPKYRHLVAKSSTTSGQLDIWSASGSG